MIFWSTTGFRMPTTPWLTTINSDGSPHVTGVGALWVDGSFRCETADGTRKGRNLARTHGACLPSPPGRALRLWNGPAYTRQRRWKTRQASSKTFQSASFTFNADCNPADARWTLSAATPAEFQEPVGPPISLEATSHAWSHTHHRLGLTRPSPSSSAERSPSRGPVSISLRLHVILHSLVVVLAGLADLLDRLTRA
jgi:Pyridoxamine 5'-phosphate oxidase